MKVLAVFICIILFGVVYAQKIERITITYIPWSVGTKGKLSEDDLKGLKKTHFFEVESDSALSDFESTLAITNFTKTTLEQMDARMSLDVYYTDSSSIAFLISYNPMMNGPGMIKYENSYFNKNEKLNSWIKKYIPFRYTMKDEYIEIVGEDREYSEQEINSLKEQGIIILPKK